MLKHMVSYSIADWLHAAVHVVLTIVFAAKLTPAAMGSLSIVLVTVTLFTILINLGLPGLIMTRYGAYEQQERKSKLDSIFWLMTFLSLISFIPLLLILSSFPQITQKVFLGASACAMIAGTALLQIPLVIIRSERKVFQYTILKAVHAIFLLAAIIPFLVLDMISVPLIMIIEAAASFVALFSAMALSGFFPPPVPFLSLRSLFKYSMPLCLLSLAHFLVDLSDRYIVTWFLGASAMGQYALAARVAVIGSFISEGFNSMWAPFYYREGFRNKPLVAKRIVSFTYFALILFVTLQITLPALAKLQIGSFVIIDPSYHPGLILIVPLVSQYFFKFLYYTSAPMLLHKGKNWILFIILFLSGTLNVIGNMGIILIFRQAPDTTLLLGISIMTVLSYLLAAVATFYVTGKEKLLIIPVKHLLTAGIISLIAGYINLLFYS